MLIELKPKFYDCLECSGIGLITVENKGLNWMVDTDCEEYEVKCKKCKGTGINFFNGAK